MANSMQQGKEIRVVRSRMGMIYPKDSCRLTYLCLKDQGLLVDGQSLAVGQTLLCIWQRTPRWAPVGGTGGRASAQLDELLAPSPLEPWPLDLCLCIVYWLKDYSVFLKILWTVEEKLSKIQELGFPGGAVDESLPANAGDTGSCPGLGGSHMPRSNWAREPQLLSLRVWSLCSATREAAIMRGPRTAMKSGPHLPQLEKALAQKWRPNTAKNK